MALLAGDLAMAPAEPEGELGVGAVAGDAEPRILVHVSLEAEEAGDADRDGDGSGDDASGVSAMR
jgi:hypothetical protein